MPNTSGPAHPAADPPTLPLSVDLEMGYGLNADDIYANILCLIELGVVGINLEDSTIDRGQRRLQTTKTFAGTLGTIADLLAKDNLDLFLNVRCDTYLLDVPEKAEETKSRLKHYEDSGASGIFLPCIIEEADIEAAVTRTRLPLNVMHIPGLPDLETLASLGVRRVSMGPFLYSKTYENCSIIDHAFGAL